jgi:eukaryotic-like serine/threonine-protein kinase
VGAAEVATEFDARRRLTGAALGRYQVGPRIGAGGSAAVYLGRLVGAPVGQELVALKVVHDHLSEETEFISQFVDEANLLVRLSHPSIVRVLELGRHGETMFLAMEYLHGLPLSKLVSTLGRRGERLPAVVVAWLGARIAEGLGYAHALCDENGRSLGVVHRDVSPQNVFVTYDGRVKLIDFGIARAEGRILQTTLGRLKGKFSYMAPEQVLGRDFDHRADLFALGATLYEAAIGARLFAGVDQSETLQKLLFDEIPDPAERVPDFPAELTRVLLKALANEPDTRYQTGAELARDLDAFVAASGAVSPARQLAELLALRFGEDRAGQDLEIRELRAAALPDVHLSEPNWTGHVSGTHTIPAKRRRPLWAFLVGGLALAGLIVGALVLVRAGPKPPAPPPVVVSPDVTLEISTQPDSKATVRVDGTEVQGRPARITKRRGDRPLAIEVQAEGYEVARLSVTPDHDQSIVVPLTKQRPPAPVATASGAPSASAMRPPRGAPPVRRKGKDPLVTKYPF